jgi:hypothetical protein
MDHALFCPQAATSGPKRTEIRSVLWGRGDALEHLQPRPLKRPPKGFGVRRTKTRSQPSAPKALSIRLGPIRCQTPRARSRYTRDASGTPNTTKSEVRSGGADASVTHERTLNRRLQLPEGEPSQRKPHRSPCEPPKWSANSAEEHPPLSSISVSPFIHAQ